MQNVIKAAVGLSAFQSQHVLRRLDDEERSRVPLEVGANPAGIFLGEVLATAAKADLLVQVGQSGAHVPGISGFLAKDVKGQAGGRLLADPRKLAEKVDEFFDGGAQNIPGMFIPPMRLLISF